MYPIGRAFFLLLFLALSACTPPDTPIEKAVEPANLRFVGRAVCVECHTRQDSLWSDSHHDLAMQEVSETTVLGDFSGSTFTHAGITSTFSRQDGEFIVNTDGPDGVSRDYQVAYTFGVTPLQQYLIETTGGRLQALSIAWDTRPADAGGQRWFHLYPDEEIDHTDILHWTGPQQNWNYMCAECHSTNLRKKYSSEEDRYETSWSEINVSCEACHGPASVHVEWARDPESVSYGETLGLTTRLGKGDKATWVFDEGSDIARRSRPRTEHSEIETCARCHSRRALINEDFIAGKQLVDTHRPALLETRLYHPDGQILEEVYVYGSFLQSRMYAAGVTCSDCHEPHNLKVNGQGDGVCLQCHLADRFASMEHHHHNPDTPAGRCISCHMPATTYMVVDPRHDHSFRVPRPDVSAKLGTPDACTGCHMEKTTEWASNAVTSWYPATVRDVHYGEILAAGRNHLPGAGHTLRDLVLDMEVPGIVRATAMSLIPSNPAPGALGAIGRALQDTDPLVRLAAVQTLEYIAPESRPTLGAPLLLDSHRAIRTEAARLLASSPADLFSPEQRSALRLALDEYRDIQHLNADRASSWMNLGVLHADTGEPHLAERAYTKALEMTTAGPAASINLADLYRRLERESEGESALRAGLERWPEDADLHHALGLLLVRKGAGTESLAALERATVLDTESTRYAFVFAIALNSTGATDRALSVLESTHQRHPGDPQILGALATISRDAGRLDDAIIYARLLVDLNPEDQQAEMLLQQLERLER